jgi:hypothetical protein
VNDCAVPATARSAAYVNYVLRLIFLVAAFNVCDRTIVSWDWVISARNWR